MRLTAERTESDFGGALRRAGVIAAALYLALVQILSAAHASPGNPDATHHHSSACVLCVTAQGVAHGLAPSVFEPAPPDGVLSFAPVAPAHLLVPARYLALVSRGPPSV